MAKSNLDNESIKPYMLVDKDEFRRQLDERIAIGKQLLEINVEGRNVNKGYSFDGFGRPYQEFSREYDETQLQNLEDKFNKWDEYNYELIKFAFKTPANQYLITYSSKGRQGVYTGDEDMLELYREEISQKMAYMESLKEIITLVPYDSSYKTVEKAKTTEIKVHSKKIFVVHGHNELMKQSVARVVSKLKLEPIILHEQADGGKTIIEKFESNAEHIGYAVILLSADDLAVSKAFLQSDEGKKKGLESSLSHRARQNVVFEMGYFIGKLGRSHTFLLLEDGVEKPGDIDGMVYTSFDSEGIWKFKLVKELKNCGYNVSADDIM